MEEESLANSYKEQGNKEYKAGNFMEAIEFYTKAIEKKKDKIFYTNRAHCFFQLKKFIKAVSDCDEAIKLDPEYAKAYFRKADAYLSLGELDRAFETILTALDKKPQDNDIKNKLQEVKVLQSYKADYDKALEKSEFETCLRKIECLLDKCPNYRAMIVKKIELTAYLGKIEDAFALVKKYQQDYSSYSDFTWVQGLVYLYRGNTYAATDSASTASTSGKKETPTTRTSRSSATASSAGKPPTPSKKKAPSSSRPATSMRRWRGTAMRRRWTRTTGTSTRSC